MLDLVKLIVQALVDNPEQVEITAIDGNRATVFELKAAKEDLGKIIGKRGRNVEAVRTILNAASAKTDRRITLEIIEE